MPPQVRTQLVKLLESVDDEHLSCYLGSLLQSLDSPLWADCRSSPTSLLNCELVGFLERRTEPLGLRLKLYWLLVTHRDLKSRQAEKASDPQEKHWHGIMRDFCQALLERVLDDGMAREQLNSSRMLEEAVARVRLRPPTLPGTMLSRPRCAVSTPTRCPPPRVS